MRLDQDCTKTTINFVPFGIMVPIAHIPNDKVYEYLDKLKNFHSDTQLCASFDIELINRVNKNNFPEKQLLDIIPDSRTHSPLCTARGSSGCIKNIKNGKCLDPFVRENIGKVFFANKYKDDNKR